MQSTQLPPHRSHATDEMFHPLRMNPVYGDDAQDFDISAQGLTAPPPNRNVMNHATSPDDRPLLDRNNTPTPPSHRLPLSLSSGAFGDKGQDKQGDYFDRSSMMPARDKDVALSRRSGLIFDGNFVAPTQDPLPTSKSSASKYEDRNQQISHSRTSSYSKEFPTHKGETKANIRYTDSNGTQIRHANGMDEPSPFNDQTLSVNNNSVVSHKADATEDLPEPIARMKIRRTSFSSDEPVGSRTPSPKSRKAQADAGLSRMGGHLTRASENGNSAAVKPNIQPQSVRIVPPTITRKDIGAGRFIGSRLPASRAQLDPSAMAGDRDVETAATNPSASGLAPAPPPENLSTAKDALLKVSPSGMAMVNPKCYCDECIPPPTAKGFFTQATHKYIKSVMGWHSKEKKMYRERHNQYPVHGGAVVPVVGLADSLPEPADRFPQEHCPVCQTPFKATKQKGKPYTSGPARTQNFPCGHWGCCSNDECIAIYYGASDQAIQRRKSDPIIHNGYDNSRGEMQPLANPKQRDAGAKPLANPVQDQAQAQQTGSNDSNQKTGRVKSTFKHFGRKGGRSAKSQGKQPESAVQVNSHMKITTAAAMDAAASRTIGTPARHGRTLYCQAPNCKRVIRNWEMCAASGHDEISHKPIAAMRSMQHPNLSALNPNRSPRRHTIWEGTHNASASTSRKNSNDSISGKKMHDRGRSVGHVGGGGGHSRKSSLSSVLSDMTGKISHAMPRRSTSSERERAKALKIERIMAEQERKLQAAREEVARVGAEQARYSRKSSKASKSSSSKSRKGSI